VHEARFIAGEIKRLGRAGLAADEWKDIAILCPRRDWLHIVESALGEAGIKAQLHSGDEAGAGSTPRAWLTALLWIAAHPEDSFEVAGVLRDVLGVADDAMAIFTGGDGDLLRLDRAVEKDTGEVGRALVLLRRACEGLSAMPLDRAVRQLMERTRLRDRVVSLEEENEELVDREFDELLSVVDRRAAENATLPELAQELRDALGKVSPAGEEVREDSVQLFTWHKSKGLEWQTVIVPFLFRSFSEKSPNYPRVILLNGQETIYRDRPDYEAAARAQVEHRNRQQFQRLLYVTCTRPKNTLLLVDDKEVFADAERNFPYRASDLLRLEGDASELWQGLPTGIRPKPALKKKPTAPPELIPPYPPLQLPDFDAALLNARTIPRRVTPHALARHSPPEAEPESIAERDEPQADSPAIRYGIWWHETMETLPWPQPRDSWERHLEAALKSAPQPERARKECEILRESELAQWLATPGLIVHRELPFLAPETGRCVEGVIDLAVYSPADGRWHVIDWKTNRATSGELVEIYRGQIEAYVDAVRKLLGATVEGGLYLTATGEWTRLGATVVPGSTTS
jgi:ATP-dependent exoDNAse (exonuclease V) beta subunit